MPVNLSQIQPSRVLIAWDIGALLLKLDYGNFYEECAKHAKISPASFKQSFINSHIEDNALIGDVTFEQVYRIMSEKLHITIDKVPSIMKYAWPAQIDEIVALKKELQDQGYATGLLSNMTDYCKNITQPIFPEIYRVSSLELAIYSFEAKAIKPDSKIYDAVPTNKFDQVIFIDDKPDYLEPIIERGWIGIHYSGHIDKEEALRAQIGHNKQKVDQESKIYVAKDARELRQALAKLGVGNRV